MKHRHVAAFAAALLVAAACSASESSDPDITTQGTTTTTVATEPGRIAVVAGTEAVIVAPDGTDVVAVGGDDAVTQPVWAPGGERLAWSFTGADDAGVATSDGMRIDLGGTPFYLSWSPEGSRIAYLMPAPTGIEFGLIDAATGAVDHRDEGQPYYFSWAPGGAGLLRHVGNELTETGLDPKGDDVDDPAVFQAPSWIGDRQVFAAQGASRSNIVVRNTSTGNRTAVAAFDGFALFSLSPDGARVAWLAVGEAGPAVAALQGTGPPLKVHNLDRETTVTLEPAVAFFWDRGGTQLLYLTTTDGIALQWHVWSEDGTSDLDVFEPSATFAREYLPFFDQYGQSHRFWNPDGTAFVFAGSVGNEAGIWVRSLDSARAERIAEGDVAIWS